MQSYIGCKFVQAEFEEKNGVPGYKVVYPDGYVSWSPKEVFEKAYLPIDPNPKLKSNISISPKMVESFIDKTEVVTMGESTTVVRAILKNGFEFVESSSCVDPSNYSEKIGVDICLKKIRDHVWLCLGFLLQSSVNGFKR